MNLEQLKIFISVLEHKSFTKAADAMYISHSTTSRNVAALEEYLETQLLERDSRRVKATSAGEMLLNEGRQLLQRVTELEAAIKRAGSCGGGKLTIASVNLFSKELSEAYKSFCILYPDIVLGMYHREMSEIFSQTYSGEADLGVSFSYALPEEMESFEKLVAAKERFCLVVPPNHPLAQRKAVKPQELISSCYISVGEQRSGFTKRLEETILQGRAQSEILSVPTLESLFLQVQSGNGISLVPCPMAREYGSNCSILDIEGLDSSFEIVLFWRKDNKNPSLPLLLELIAKPEGNKAGESSGSCL